MYQNLISLKPKSLLFIFGTQGWTGYSKQMFSRLPHSHPSGTPLNSTLERSEPRLPPWKNKKREPNDAPLATAMEPFFLLPIHSILTSTSSTAAPRGKKSHFPISTPVPRSGCASGARPSRNPHYDTRNAPPPASLFLHHKRGAR
jgi:hypothetical protein